MQKHLINFLNQPFPVFLAFRKGRIYFIWMILIFILLANIVQPFGLCNNHEFHKPLVLSNYIVVFFIMYALVYLMLSYFRPGYYKFWTIRKEFSILFLFFIPLTACATCLFVVFSVPAFKLTLTAFIELQFYNFILSILSIPTFGYFVDTKFNSRKPESPAKPEEKPKSSSHLTEEQALKILKKLKELMETERLYLTKKCSLQFVANSSGISIHRISEAINNFSDDNFYDFVNRYRVEHACLLLQNGQKQHFKIEAIGRECGFESRSSFYKAFKMFTGKTTSEYLEELEKGRNDNTAPN